MKVCAESRQAGKARHKNRSHFGETHESFCSTLRQLSLRGRRTPVHAPQQKNTQCGAFLTRSLLPACYASPPFATGNCANIRPHPGSCGCNLNMASASTSPSACTRNRRTPATAPPRSLSFWLPATALRCEVRPHRGAPKPSALCGWCGRGLAVEEGIYPSSSY